MPDADIESLEAPIAYMQRTRDWYLALGYGNPYEWAHYRDVPFQPLKKPLSRSRVALITTAAPYQAGKGEQGPGAHFYLLFAASQSQNPLGAWNLYRLDTTDSSKTGCPCLLNDLKLGVNGDALFVSGDEQPYNGANGYLYGGQVYVVDKLALEAGDPPNVVQLDLGSLATPDGPCDTQTGVDCWSSVSPALSPNAAYDTGHGGTEYFLSSLDFSQTVDNRIELWAVAATGTIHTSPSLLVYRQTLGSESYGVPPVATQKTGPIPLGDTQPPPQPEGPISTRANLVPDGMDQVGFAAGDLVWGALNTVVQFPAPPGVPPDIHAGIAYFGVKPAWNLGGFDGTIAAQGYIANSKEDVLTPAIAVDPKGDVVVAHTLTGTDYYPSTAFSRLTAKAPPALIDLADLGQSPNDDFTEYQTIYPLPAYGFYATAVADGKNVYFGTQYVQFPNCSDGAFLGDPSCTGTRTLWTNWSTTLNSTPAK